ncbi:MAG: histidinol-phosphate transaminase [Bacteroidales bacterium]|nr:histidinol-phosphate transaminase [Bacteroidales bacterium]
MIELEKLVRKNILALEPYTCAREEYSGNEGIFLDANENPYGQLNRYPDPKQKLLKQKLSELKNIDLENIFLGNASDEIIDLLIRIFCNPGKDKILVFTPTYGMYKVAAAINDVEIIEMPLTKQFQPDLQNLPASFFGKTNCCKIAFFCSPNNPTGNILEIPDWFISSFTGIVVVDEAYIDFCKQKSFIGKIANHQNLVVLQTFSKSWGLAAARVGMAFSNQKIVALLNKVKPPYNISTPNQLAAIEALENVESFTIRLVELLEEKDRLLNELLSIPYIKKVFPSDANFFLVEVTNAEKIYSDLLKAGIVVRNRSSVVKNCLRISVGTREQNLLLIEKLKNL